MSSIDLQFRPGSYWDASDPLTAILANIKGENRRQMARDFITGQAPAWLGEIDPDLLDGPSPLPVFTLAPAQLPRPLDTGQNLFIFGAETSRMLTTYRSRVMRQWVRGAGLAALALSAGGKSIAAQETTPRFFVEGLGGAVVPTFNVSDVVRTGAAFGGTLGYRVNDRWVAMAEFDYGMHKDEATNSVDINTLHYMAKVGYSLTGPRERGWEVIVNLGAGAVSFDVDGAPESFTYFAINAGAKIAYNFSRSVAFVFSPQGDIAFSDESELATTNAWVWPVTAGLRVSF